MKSCFICETSTESYLDATKEVTSFTGRSIFDIFSIINGSITLNLDFICQSCMQKCNEFDEYSTKAEQIMRDFQNLLENRKDFQIKEEPREEFPYIIPETSFASFSWSNTVKNEDFFDSDSEPAVNPFKSERKSKKRGRPAKSKEFSETFYCTEPGCNRRFANRAKLNFHVQYHSKERPFQCQQCGKCFKTKSCLGSHRRAVHKDKRTICDTCGMNFSRKQGLLRHYQAAHLGLKPYICQICGMAYNNSSSLKSHQFTHDPENKTVVCHICSARFFNKSKLDRHMKSHGEKEYQCQICSRMFSQRYNLTAHMKTVHGIGAQELKASTQPIICQLCGRIFEKQKMLEAHLRSVHEAVPLTASF